MGTGHGSPTFAVGLWLVPPAQTPPVGGEGKERKGRWQHPGRRGEGRPDFLGRLGRCGSRRSPAPGAGQGRATHVWPPRPMLRESQMWGGKRGAPPRAPSPPASQLRSAPLPGGSVGRWGSRRASRRARSARELPRTRRATSAGAGAARLQIRLLRAPGAGERPLAFKETGARSPAALFPAQSPQAAGRPRPAPPIRTARTRPPGGATPTQPASRGIALETDQPQPRPRPPPRRSHAHPPGVRLNFHCN